MDFASTFLDFVGIQLPEKFQGKRFRENLNNSSSENWRKSIYCRYCSNESERPCHLGIRTDRYKLFLFYNQNRLSNQPSRMKYLPGWEFYNFKNNPNSNKNSISK
jgi:hypothetical protein